MSDLKSNAPLHNQFPFFQDIPIATEYFDVPRAKLFKKFPAIETIGHRKIGYGKINVGFFMKPLTMQ